MSSEEYFVFNNDDINPKEDIWFPDIDEQPTMGELERYDYESQLFDLIMKKANSLEGLPQEENERMHQIMHFLKGNAWDDYKGEPENAKLRQILQDPFPGFISESIDDCGYN